MTDPQAPHPTSPTTAKGLDPAALVDATVVIAEGQQLARAGVRYLVPGLIPAYGMLGMLVAYTKVGKTALGQWLGAEVAMRRAFLGRPTQQTRVLVLALEDPPEYTAYLARHLEEDEGQMTFYRQPLVLNATNLAKIAATVTDGRYGLLLIASWQAAVRGLVKDENDNAGAARVVEDVKAVARETKIPWLIDAHSGKNEKQSDAADPSKSDAWGLRRRERRRLFPLAPLR